MPLTDNTVYTKHTGARYPLVDVAAPLYVVASSSAPDGLGGLYATAYQYAGLKVDLSGRGMLGFAKTTAIDKQTGIVTDTHYSQDFPHVGMVLRSETSLHGKLLSGVSNTLDSFITASSSVYFPHLASSAKSTFELPGGADNLVMTVITSNAYDASGEGLWGNAGRVTVTTTAGAGNYVRDTVNHYQPADTVNWYLGRLDLSTVAPFREWWCAGITQVGL